MAFSQALRWRSGRLPFGLVPGSGDGLLLARAGECLALWVSFNAAPASAAAGAWLAQAGFVANLLWSLLVWDRFGRGPAGRGWVAADLVANVASLAPALLCTGGARSPLLPLFAVKSAEYALAVGGGAATVFSVLTALAAVGRASVGSVVAPSAGSASVGAELVIAWLLLACAPLAAAFVRQVGWGREGASSRPPPADGDVGGAIATALLSVSEAVSRLTRIDDILAKVVEIAPPSVRVDECGIVLWSADSGTYTSVAATASAPGPDRSLPGTPLRPEEAPDFEWVRRLGHCAVVPRPLPTSPDERSTSEILIAPLSSGSHFFGVVQFARRAQGRPFTQRDITIAEGIARQTAVALERARLVEESRSLVRALESTGEAVFITDADRRVVFANPAFLRTFGYAEAEVLGCDAQRFVPRSEEWWPEPGGQLERTGWRGEVDGARKDGTPVPLVLDVSLMRNEDGRQQGWVAIAEDVSAQKEMQEQIQRADRLAAVGQMAAGMAHEINNALMGILSQTSRADGLEPSEIRLALQRVDGQARRIGEIVQGVLGFARPRAPRPAAVDVARVCRDTIDLIGRDLERQAVEVALRVDPATPPVFADSDQVQQVLLNLFSNAVQATAGCPSRRVDVSVCPTEHGVAVRVADTGPGIPGEVLPRVFDPFYTTKSDGTGLGLSVSYAIAQANGGDLIAVSPPGQGAVFTLLLPAVRRPAPGTARRVLLVDDDEAVAEALGDMLRREGADVAHAASGAEAVKMASAADWDAIFLDVRLPDLSGAQVFAEIARARPELADRVVFVTGGLWRDGGDLRSELPGNRFLAKPCTQEQVRAALRSLP